MIVRAKYGLGATLMIILAACSAASKTETHAKNSDAQSSNTPIEDVAEEPKPTPAKTPPMLTETDQLMLEQAQNACRNSDFKSFFEALLRSKPVRLRYFEKPITTETGIRSVDDYAFPFEIVDYNYVTSTSRRKGPAEWEYVKLEYNEAQDERYSVDWTRIDFGANGNDEGETPEDDKEYGPPGRLLFYPTNECWTLIEDNIFE